MSDLIKHIILLIKFINLVTWCIPMDRELIDGRVHMWIVRNRQTVCEIWPK